MRVKSLFILLFCIAGVSVCSGQRVPIIWNCNADRIGTADWVIRISASLRPGWHVYSQYLNEGGPIPTTITLDLTDDYYAVGKAAEQGAPVKFYDSLYEIEITWYTQQVTFLQKVKLNRPISLIHGTIDYIACDEHLCIPNREEFTVVIQSSDTKP